MPEAKTRKLLRGSRRPERETRRAELRLVYDSLAARRRDGHCAYLRRFFWRYYDENGRSFPWRRKTTSAFALLVAETLLKQTKATDVVSVWCDLLERYPTARDLARAHQRTLCRMLKPLGLQRQRAAALASMSKAIVRDFSGRVPKEIEDLVELPYVGLYSACALASFRYGTRVPIVDANVLRVLSRLTGDNFGRDLRRNHEVWALAWAILPRNRFAEHNYGLLDFSALVCTARNPGCSVCPLRRRCAYGRMRTGAAGGVKEEG
jgi:A/G-specific adenine glycosylase